ncbi:MAG: hypothetical protein WAL63_09650 [Solirubrobacteraceae bacterium]
MNDDWRVKIDLREHGFAKQLGELLGGQELEHDLESTFHDRVVVSVDGPEVFCYTGSRDQAERARQLIAQLSEQHRWAADIQLAHWHPTAEEWEDPDAPLPTDPAAIEAEREARVADERAESAAQGYPEFEVRVECHSRREAGKLSDKLGAEGLPNIHRWNWVMIGATDEDSANALAERIRAEVPPGSKVDVETNMREIYDNIPRSPFRTLGGLFG